MKSSHAHHVYCAGLSLEILEGAMVRHMTKPTKSCAPSMRPV